MDVLDRIKNNKVVLLDGAMGTELARRGLEMGGKTNLIAPDQVLAIHREYIKAGADILITNTLTMNRISIELHGQGINVSQVNLTGAALARKAITGKQLVFGDIGPTGQFLEPYGEYTEAQFQANFREQAEFLSRGGVNGFIIETMSDLREAACALRACRDLSDMPVFVCLSFSSAAGGGNTIMGNTVRETAEMAEEFGATAVGANCGDMGPEDMARLVKLFREATALPVIIQPNAGKPVLNGDGTTTFNMGPSVFSSELIQCIKNGATLAGGCCGTTPDHIRAIARKLKDPLYNGKRS
jgi:5-methyltetrahydrofolate--homocysteine methyltransferase